MAYEDFDDYELENTQATLSINGNRIDWAGLARDHDTRCWKDFGTGAFGDNFTHTFEMDLEPGDNYMLVSFWMLSQDEGESKSLLDAGKPYVSAYWYRSGAGFYYVYLEEYYEGETHNTVNWLTANLIDYYCTIERDGSSLVLYIYDKPEKDPEDLVQTLTITLSQSYHYRYFYPINSVNNGTSGALSEGWVRKYDLNRTDESSEETVDRSPVISVVRNVLLDPFEYVRNCKGKNVHKGVL